MKKVRVYPFPVEPEKYPWFDRRAVPVVTRKTLGDRIQFSSLRGFPSDEGLTGPISPMKKNARLVQVEETVDMYVHHFKLGRVLWPVYPTLFASNFNDMVDICAREGLYLYDFWGFVPGAEAADDVIWGEYVIPEEADACMQEKLGDHFLGYDNGEQDGRYVHARARRQTVLSLSRERQYEVFQEYFEKLNDSMRNYTVTLASLTFLPYFAREGNTIMLGAETAQALPCSSMWFSFIRGAARQYGLLYYGNVSVWNRWGKKLYDYPDREPVVVGLWGGSEMGRCAGTSLSLLKRLMYSQWMYGCDILGFENSWLVRRPKEEGDATDERRYVIGDDVYHLTPIGDIQQKCAEFIEMHGRAGVMHAPVALMLDFHAGWMPPRHMYVSDVYKVWGSLPYGPGDYQIHCLLGMLYPHYEDAGFFRDERGFDPPTPYGEIMDVLLSDAQAEILGQYSLLVLTRGVRLDRELKEKIARFAKSGGTVIAFAGTVKEWSAEELFGVRALAEGEDGEFDALLCGGAEKSGLLVTRRLGAGETRLILHEHGLEATGEELTPKNSRNQTICQPYRLTGKTEEILAAAYGEVQLIRVTNPSLQYVTSVLSRGEYTFMVSSPQPQTETFDIVSEIGEIESIEEMPTSDGVEALEEFLPLHRAEPGEAVMTEGEYTIDPGCMRLFRIRVKDARTEDLGESNPAKREGRRYIALPKYETRIKRTVLDHPTLQHHFDGVVVPARYLEDLDMAAAKKEAHYLNLQKVSIIVDFGDLINHYPDLTLVGNIGGSGDESVVRIEAILDKAKEYLCDGVILCTQKTGEVGYGAERGAAEFTEALAGIRRMCDERGLRMMVKNGVYAETRADITAPDTAAALVEGMEDMPETAEMLLLSRPGRDLVGQLYQMNLPVSDGQEDLLTRWAREAMEKKLPIALTAEYERWDEVISDIDWLNRL